MTEELKLPDEREAFYAFANSIGLTLKQAEQMRAAILAERERCAKACEAQDAWNMDDPGETAAAVIRSGTWPAK